MRKLVFLLFVITQLKASAQTLFFDQLNSTTWYSEEINDSLLQKTKGIGLTRLNVQPAPANTCLWMFKNGALLLLHYDKEQQKHSLISYYNYEADRDRCILSIRLNDGTTATYKIGIVSTGNAAFLMRTKEKKKKTKKS